ncbi:DUF3164 family protein [Sphingobium sp. AS12]|uniref:DUF3164 family protein n=1 Tax=Sphingobium sp. AS12 TaxID=2849495 RepID=UPI001C31D321|nr:DUF3164 family protein [Sphingobium sp. AS12]MBV2147911.1 DUF3164 family protein [Sphingobium sp. AS12]
MNAITNSEGRREIDGVTYMIDGKGGLIPAKAVKPQDLLQDELVRKIMGFAEPISAQVARFRQHTLDDVDAFVALIEQEYGAKRGGKKGNLSFVSYDGLLKVDVGVGENISFGPELQIAKELVDECLRDWSQGTREELKAVINRAFDVDSQGKVNRNDLFYLLRLDIEDDRWQQAMRAIRDSIRVIGSKRYVRIYRRPDAESAWEAVSVNMATAS